MNNNKQQTEGNKMKKIIIISLLAIIATKANAWEIASPKNNGIGVYDFYSINENLFGKSFNNISKPSSEKFTNCISNSWFLGSEKIHASALSINSFPTIEDDEYLYFSNPIFRCGDAKNPKFVTLY